MARVYPVASALTYRDYLALPDAGPRLELIDGTTVATAGPGRLHQAAVTEAVRGVGVHALAALPGTEIDFDLIEKPEGWPLSTIDEPPQP